MVTLPLCLAAATAHAPEPGICSGQPGLPAHEDSDTPLVEYTDVSSPLSVSLGEGELAAMAVGTDVVVFDRVGRYPYTVEAF